MLSALVFVQKQVWDTLADWKFPPGLRTDESTLF